MYVLPQAAKLDHVQLVEIVSRLQNWLFRSRSGVVDPDNQVEAGDMVEDMIEILQAFELAPKSLQEAAGAS